MGRPTRLGLASVTAHAGRGAFGVVVVMVSAAFFALSGPVAKVLYAGGWTPGSVVLARLAGAFALLAVPAAVVMRGRWGELWANWRGVVNYGLFAVAGMQVLFFVAVQYLEVTVALLLQLTAPVMVVFWLWARTRQRPSGATFAGAAVSLVGLAIVLDPRGAQVHLFGAAMALASGVCLASYFLASARQTQQLPPVAFTCFGFAIGGLVVAALTLTPILPARFVASEVSFGPWAVSWAVPVALIVAFTVGAYLLGIFGLRLTGATVGSFVNLTEVVFAGLAAWLVIGEAPAPQHAVGGAVILLGIAGIRWGEVRMRRRLTG